MKTAVINLSAKKPVLPDFPPYGICILESRHASDFQMPVSRYDFTEVMLIRESLGDGPTCLIPHRIWQLGDIVIVSIPNEPYSKLQVALRAAIPEKAVFVATLANGINALGYLPPENFYDRDIYPVWQTPFAEGCLELLIRQLVSELKK